MSIDLQGMMMTGSLDALFRNDPDTLVSTPRILGSMDSVSTHHQAQAASASTDKAEELMKAPSFLIASLGGYPPSGDAPKGFLMGSSEASNHNILGGSMESLRRGTSGLTNHLTMLASVSEEGMRAEGEDKDKDTELPMFQRPRRSTRSGRGLLGASRSQDEPFRLGSMTGSTLQLHSNNSNDWPISKSTDRSTQHFLELIENELNGLTAPTPRAHSTRSSREAVPEIAEEEAPRMSTRRSSQATRSTSVDVAPTPRTPRTTTYKEKEIPAHRPSRKATKQPAARESKVGSKRKVDGSGTHVKYRPDMQKRARDGQEHWMKQVKSIRGKWAERKEFTQNARYQEQVDFCAQLQIKSQHECMLRTLQMCASDGIIVALPFAECGPDSFLGWTGFQVVQAHAQDFRHKIDSLFPAPLKENTLHTAFRRAGLVPDKWSSGWLGLTPFKYSHDKRVAYAPSEHAAQSY